MNTINLTDEEIRSRGLEALARELGPAGLIRFLKQFDLGQGDYSKDRHRGPAAGSVRNLAIKRRRLS